MPILWFIPLLIVLVLLGGAYYFARILVYPNTRSYQQSLESAVEDGFMSENGWEELSKEQVIIRSPFDYDLQAYYLPNGESKRTVIVSHGITQNAVNSTKYAQVFLELGFNALVYDHRNHGKSGGQGTTFGYYEADDLRAVIDWLLENKPETGLIGIHGESMGSAIGLLAAARDERVAFMVADCGYASLFDQVSDRARVQYRLPSFPLVPLVFLWARLINGMRINQIAPEQALTKIKAPVLIIHGEQDAYIEPSHAHRLVQADPEHPRQLWLAPDADHAESLLKHKAEYWVQVASFLKEQGLLG